jgi:hypothetical protein
MDSESLRQLGHLLEWRPLDRLTVQDTPYKQESVYMFRSGFQMQRKRGSSDILYIGSSNNLVRRILGNYLGGVGGPTTKRIHGLLFEEGFLHKTDVGWVTTEIYESLEDELLARFQKEHGELPPWNKRS